MTMISRFSLFFGLACLATVALTHVAEKLRVFPSMGWGLPDSPGHYLDLSSAVIGGASILLSLGLKIMARRKRSHQTGH